MDALLATPADRAARAELLAAPHVQRLEAWRRAAAAPGPIPHVDPADGGIAARLLLLLETPGLGASPLRFVSRDNPTAAGRNLRRFLAGAGIARGDTLIWNAVPWVVHASGARNRPVRAGEVREGLALLQGFLDLLPRLAVVVLSVRVAAQAAPVVAAARLGMPVILIPHPSPTIVCTSPAVGARIAEGLGKAAAILRER